MNFHCQKCCNVTKCQPNNCNEVKQQMIEPQLGMCVSTDLINEVIDYFAKFVSMLSSACASLDVSTIEEETGNEMSI